MTRVRASSRSPLPGQTSALGHRTKQRERRGGREAVSEGLLPNLKPSSSDCRIWPKARVRTVRFADSEGFRLKTRCVGRRHWLPTLAQRLQAERARSDDRAEPRDDARDLNPGQQHRSKRGGEAEDARGTRGNRDRRNRRRGAEPPAPSASQKTACIGCPPQGPSTSSKTRAL